MINLDSRSFSIAFWIGIGLLFIGAVSQVEVSWASVFVLLMLAIVAIVVMSLPFVPRAMAVLFVIIALSDGAGFTWNLFRRLTPYYDNSCHFFSALAMAWAFGYWSYRARQPQSKTDMLMYVIQIISYSFAIGALWEIIEWPAQIMGDAADTACDLLMDLCGATLGASTMLLAMKQGWIVRIPPRSSLPQHDFIATVPHSSAHRM